MPWSLLLDLRVILGIALIATGVYAKIQTVRMEEAKAEYAQFRADVESEAAKAKVAAAQESTRRALAAQGVLDDLQTRYDALNARYRVLRSSAGSGPVPALSAAAPSLSACPAVPNQPDPIAGRLDDLEGRFLAVLETGDREIAKYRELWDLQKKNATVP